MLRFLPKERIVFVVIITVLLGIIAYGAVWFNEKYVLMPIERVKVESVTGCIDNTTACSLIITDKDDIPE